MKKKGTIQSWRDAEGRLRYRGRVTLADGSRPWITCEPGTSEEKAKNDAEYAQEQENKTGAMLAAKTARLLDEARARGEVVVEETVDEWFGRYSPPSSAERTTAVRLNSSTRSG